MTTLLIIAGVLHLALVGLLIYLYLTERRDNERTNRMYVKALAQVIELQDDLSIAQEKLRQQKKVYWPMGALN